MQGGNLTRGLDSGESEVRHRTLPALGGYGKAQLDRNGPNCSRTAQIRGTKEGGADARTLGGEAAWGGNSECGERDREGGEGV